MSDTPKKEGRPTKYKDEFPQMLYEHMKGGLSFESFGGVAEVSETALHKWKNPNSPFFHKEFLQSYKKGLTASLMHWEELGHDLVLAGQGNATAWIFNMKNRFRKLWSDTVKQEVTGKDGVPLLESLNNVRNNNSTQKTQESQ